MIPFCCLSAEGHISVGGLGSPGWYEAESEGCLTLADGWQMGRSYQDQVECHGIFPRSYPLFLSNCW